jgi:hypothetical protein
MKKTQVGMRAVVVGLAMLTLFAGSAAAAERPGFETYVVRSGDTLGRISGRVFGDVKRWRELLKENPQITNPNRIFPGDILLVPVPATAAPAAEAGGGLAAGPAQDAAGSAAGAGAAGGEAAAGEPVAKSAGSGPDAAAAIGGGAAPVITAAPERPVVVVNPVLYRSAGHIADRLPELAIIASVDNRAVLGTGDAVIVNAPITPGTRFTVVRANHRVFHPVTGAYLGWLIRILGTAEVTCRDQRTSTMALGAMNDAANIGDYLIPLDPNDVLEKNVLPENAKPECIPARAGDGVIVAFNEERPEAGEQELAYIDRGTAAGVASGQRFTIYRPIAPEGRVPVGELQVLRAGVHTSTALITNSFQEVKVGYLLRAR